ncbi:hypothetical protein LCGC14_1227140 [marine sediment metagenome]|uniref:Uncharacterized protein n=1 Tax=marine sediment metagenome TaxID=412755 RepID=A0A0F9LWR4_9ZZZZ
MTTRYQKSQIEDVARILSDAVGIASDCDRVDCGCKMESLAICKDFADLFAADNPPACQAFHGPGHDSSCKLAGGFNREQFLAACGLES